MRFWFAMANILMLFLLGCGTTRWTNTKRSATEQLLITDAMDRAVSQLDFSAIAGKKIYIDSTHITKTTDYQYLVSTLRQHSLADGCLLKDKRDEADYIVEIRVGAIGTDHHDVLLGVPANDLSSVVPVTGLPASVPEIPLIKKTEQRAVAKIAAFAYNRLTGRPVWQSGTIPIASKAKDVWVLGAGPFQRGSIYEGTNFAGDRLAIPLISPGKKRKGEVSVTDEAYFSEPKEPLVKKENKPKSPDKAKKAVTKKKTKPASKVVPTGYSAGPEPTADAPTKPRASPPPTDTDIQPIDPLLPPKPLIIPEEANIAPLPIEREVVRSDALPLPADSQPDSTSELPPDSAQPAEAPVSSVPASSPSYNRLRGQPADHSMLQ